MTLAKPLKTSGRKVIRQPLCRHRPAAERLASAMAVSRWEEVEILQLAPHTGASAHHGPCGPVPTSHHCRPCS